MSKLSAAMKTALVKIAGAMPLIGERSLALLPCHGRTAGALEDRKLIRAVSTPGGTRWALTDAGWEEAGRLERAATEPVTVGTRVLAARIADAVADAPDTADPEVPQEQEERLVCPDGQAPADCNFWHDHTGCKCPTPPWHNPTCPALPEIRRAEEAAAVAKAAAAETEWAARNLAGKLRCQALKFEGHRCPGVITCTVTTGEWMELTEDNIEETLASETLEIDDVVKGDGSKWDACPVGETLAPGDLIFINVVHRAWCDECVEDEEKFRNDAIITPLAEGDYIPTASRYCANGYNDAACDAFCGPDDHNYQGERVQWWSASAQATVYGTVTGHGLGEFDRPWVTVRQDDGTMFSFWRSQVRSIPAPSASQLATNVRAAIGLKF